MERVGLTIEGMKATLDNGLIKFVFNERGSVDSIIKNNKEILAGLEGADNDVNRKRSFYLDYHANGEFRDFNPDELKVIEKRDDFIHIAYFDKTSLLYAEYHIIMESNLSGIYSYVIVSNNSAEPLQVGELRTVYRMGIDNFNMAYNAEKIGRQPTHVELQKQLKLQDETFKYGNGQVYSKYDYAGYFKDNPLWGQYGEEFGAWFIPVSTEYYPSGPMKQELLVHYDGIILNYMTGAHFGTGVFDVPKDWQKLYGPWLFYINDGNGEEIINDARNKAEEERKKWPYKWVHEKLYPLNRGNVSGEIKCIDGRSTANAMVVLAKEGGEFLRQKGDYIFYGQCDDNGSFKLENVRPGEYTLYAYATHGTITSQLEKNNVLVAAGDNNLGEILWDVPRHNNVLFQIGQSDRTAREFMFGNKARGYKWMKMLPKNLRYIIGESREADDWYYAQPKDSLWNIEFQLDKDFSQDIYLTVALAAATTYQIGLSDKPTLVIRVNGQVVKKVQYENDTTVYRSAVASGRYHLENIKFSGYLFRKGLNIVSFESEMGAFMYDAILLETEEGGSLLTIKQLINSYRVSGYIYENFCDNLNALLDEGKINEAKEYVSSKNIDKDIKEVLERSLNSLV